ncbi:MAG: SRPBCC family protein [Proteobacteria bacterium]|nr:SRPBCC family protein [Pseudomonadota bacterium]
MSRVWSILAGAALAAGLVAAQLLSAHADVVDATTNGFQLKYSFHVGVSPDKAYAALIEPNHWWSSDHTYSGSAENFTFDARAGGCWCEKLANGSVQHMTVVLAEPGKMLRLRGGLGPFQGTAVDGAMTWTLKSAQDGTDVTLDASFGGYMKGGLTDVSKGVDTVLGEQTVRLKTYLETGSPDAKR